MRAALLPATIDRLRGSGGEERELPSRLFPRIDDAYRTPAALTSSPRRHLNSG